MKTFKRLAGIAVALAITGAIALAATGMHKQIQSGLQNGFLFAKVREVSARTFNRLADKYWYSADDPEYWLPESAAERAKLPEFKTIPAAKLTELTPSQYAIPEDDFVSWRVSHGDKRATRYSKLDQINQSNVHRLKPVWTYRGDNGLANIQTNPVIVDGMLYTASGGHEIVALDATSGDAIWKFKPGDRFPAKRGMIWNKASESTEPNLYFPSGYRIISLNAITGEPNSLFGDNGVVNLGYGSKVTPMISGNILIQASLKPALHGVDLETGDLLWTTDLVKYGQPDGPGGRPSEAGGGNPWSGLALDEDRNIVYVTTGNPAPVLVGTRRHGPNDYSNSVVAADVNTGKILWTFQEVSHDLWDLDIGAPPVLLSITRNGGKYDVVAVPTKTGNILLLDRVSGKPIYDFRKRRAPVSNLPGERTHPYQPDLELPEPFAKHPFYDEDMTDIGSENRKSVIAQLATRNYGFFEPHIEGVESVFFGLHGGANWPGASADPNEGILYVASSHVPSMATVINTGTTVNEENLPSVAGQSVYNENCGSCHGEFREGGIGPNLQWITARHSRPLLMSILEQGFAGMPAMADLPVEDKESIIGYLHERDSQLKANSASTSQNTTRRYTRTQYQKLVDHEGYPGSKPPWGTLNAVDLNTGKIKWRVPLGEYKELTDRGIPKTGTENFGGPIATAGGLVFVSGTKDKFIRAFDKDTGEELWRYELPFVGSAPPATYEVNGKQYLFISATGGGTLKKYDPTVEIGDAHIAFALDG